MPTWGCDACYLFGRNRNHPIGRCAACTRELPLRKLYCLLCWCQARIDAKAVARSPAQASHLAPHLPRVRHHQLFFADLHLMAEEPPAAGPQHHSDAPAADPTIPANEWIQPPLFEIRRDFPRFDRRRHADLANPHLVDARHAARNLGEAHGWTPSVTADVDRALVILLSGHVIGETIHHSEVASALRPRGLSVSRTITVLDHLGLLDDDRTSTFDAWLNRRPHELTPGIRRDVDSWLRTLHDGGPRTRARANSTVYTYLNETYPALSDWSMRYDHLREVTRADVLAVRDAARGKQRESRIVALRSLFRHCRTNGTIFRDPTIRIRISRPTSGPILPLQPDDVDQAVAAAQADPAVRVVLALAAVHAARPRAIRELRLDDVDLGNRRLSIAGHVRPLLVIYARRQVEELHHGRGWDVEYPRDVWRLRNLGIDSPHAHLRFDRIPQPWLRELAKRWARWRLGTGICGGQATKCVNALTRFGKFLDTSGVDTIAHIDRGVLERYLAYLHALGHGAKSHGELIGLVNAFFQAIRQHGWNDALPVDAMFYTEDYPKRPQRLPRALAEHVMTQLERGDNLDRWPDPAGRLVTVILMRCGLRVGDALRLPLDCLVHDADAAPYLRYFNNKMKREALVPIDDELETAIREQQQHVLRRWSRGPVLFPQPRANPDGTKPLSSSTYRIALKRWLTDCEVLDEHRRPVHLTPHQWRHTFGTRLINKDVPQEVVRVLLDHESHQMTAHYARINEKTVRRHWDRARKVNINGETVKLDPAGPLAEAAWAKQRLGRVTQALPNGYCGLPLQQTCPHANACLTCPMFVTTAEFLPQHRTHRKQVVQLISAAQARGQARVVEMNQQVLGNLDQIITVLDAESDEDESRVADAS